QHAEGRGPGCSNGIRGLRPGDPAAGSTSPDDTAIIRPMPKPVTPLLASDCVCFDASGRLLLIRRANTPFKGQFALPGGFIDVGETVEDGCRRELMEETGIKAGRL